MKVKALGDFALLISFGDVIDEEINDRIHALVRAIERANFEWLVELVSAYSSLTVIYDPGLIDFEGVKRTVEGIEVTSERFEGNSWRFWSFTVANTVPIWSLSLNTTA